MDLKPSEQTTEAEMFVVNQVFFLDDSIAFVYISFIPVLAYCAFFNIHFFSPGVSFY